MPVLPKSRSGQLSSVRWWGRGSNVSWANRTVDVPSGPAMRRPAPTRPWYVRVLDSASKPLINRGLCSPNGLSKNSFVRASEEMIRTYVHDALGGTRDGCVLREQTCQHPTLPGPPRPAAPPCAARPDLPVVYPGFGFEKSKSSKTKHPYGGVPWKHERTSKLVKS